MTLVNLCLEKSCCLTAYQSGFEFVGVIDGAVRPVQRKKALRLSTRESSSSRLRVSPSVVGGPALCRCAPSFRCSSRRNSGSA
jgi:hypothetical protein